ncbi:DUF4279 domain-containing protein [Gryllotalpicola reticulitermitis]
MIDVTLIVQTSALAMEELVRHLGREPSRGSRKGGEVGAGRVRRATIWQLTLHAPTGVHMGLDGINDALSVLGLDFAARLGAIPDPGAEVVLQIVQSVEDDPLDEHTSNFYFSQDTVRWLATAGADVTITQYLYPDEDGTTSPRERASEARERQN